jgi:hypothetical protein
LGHLKEETSTLNIETMENIKVKKLSSEDRKAEEIRGMARMDMLMALLMAGVCGFIMSTRKEEMSLVFGSLALMWSALDFLAAVFLLYEPKKFNLVKMLFWISMTLIDIVAGSGLFALSLILFGDDYIVRCFRLFLLEMVFVKIFGIYVVYKVFEWEKKKDVMIAVKV